MTAPLAAELVALVRRRRFGSGLDKLVLLGERHLRLAIAEFVEH